MASTPSHIQVSGLGKGKLTTLRAQAKALGLTTEAYAKQLVQEGMLLEGLARSTTFDELFDPVRAMFRKSKMSEGDLEKLVDAARTRHHGRTLRQTE